MKRMFTNLFLLNLLVLFLSGMAYAQFPTIYASVATGSWGTSGTWETFTGNATNTPGAQGTGTAATSTPSGTHHIYVRAGHTVTMGAAKSSMGITVENGGTLLAGGTFTLKVGVGGTGFTGPNIANIVNNGTIGNATDVITLEVPTTASVVNISGTGTTLLGRIRIVGGNSYSPVVSINQDITLQQTGNYALSAIYNPQATDNYTINLAAGKVMTVSGVSGYLNNNSIGSGTGWGTYTYNLNGTVNLSANTQTLTNLTAFSNAGGTINLNLNGPIVTGAVFNSSPVAPGVANLNVASGITVDARLATLMSFNNNCFILNGTAALKRTVTSDGSKINFPIGTSSASNTPVVISGNTGPTDVFTVAVRNAISNTPPSLTLNKEWEITEETAGGNEDTLRFSWTVSDEGASGFSGASPVYIARWNGSAYDYTATSVSGTGTAGDPYVAKGIGFTSFGKFILTNNAGPLPVKLINFSGTIQQRNISLKFSNASESDVLSYQIERSIDGLNFNSIGSLPAKINLGAIVHYSFDDQSPVVGNNFYRIKALESRGSIVYSNAIKINFTESRKGGFNIYPNPAKGGSIINVEYFGLTKDDYQFSLINSIGQQVFLQKSQLEGNGNLNVVKLPAGLTKGFYTLKISGSTSNFTKGLSVQ